MVLTKWLIQQGKDYAGHNLDLLYCNFCRQYGWWIQWGIPHGWHISRYTKSWWGSSQGKQTRKSRRQSNRLVVCVGMWQVEKRKLVLKKKVKKRTPKNTCAHTHTSFPVSVGAWGLPCWRNTHLFTECLVRCRHCFTICISKPLVLQPTPHGLHLAIYVSCV